MILEDFNFTTAKISNDGEIEYFDKQGKYIDLRIAENTYLTLVLASNKLLEESKRDRNLSFLISKYPITQKQYYKITGNLQNCGGLGLKKPIMASWVEAIKFCALLSQQQGREYRLPYASEWEFACRAGSRDTFSFGNILTSDLANFGNEPTDLRFSAQPNPIMDVGMFPANNFGIYDMHGNVWEWCLDAQSDTSYIRPIKGGAYYSPSKSCACSYQGVMRSAHQDQVVGFRIITYL